MNTHPSPVTISDCFLPTFNRLTGRFAERVSGPIDSPMKAAVFSVSFTGASRGRLELAAGQSLVLELGGSAVGDKAPAAEVVEIADERMMLLLEQLAAELVPPAVGAEAGSLDFSPGTVRSMAVEWDWPSMIAGGGTEVFHVAGKAIAVRLVA